VLANARRRIAQDDPSAAARDLRAALEATAEPSDRVELLVLLTFAEVIRTRFTAAVTQADRAVRTSADLDGESQASAAIARALAVAFLGPTGRTGLEEVAAAFTRARAGFAEDGQDRPDLRYLLGETAMSNGAIDVALELSAPGWPDGDLVLTDLLSQVQARALAFAGRLDEADALTGRLLADTQEHGLLALEAVAHGLDAYLAAQRGDRTRLRRSMRAAMALAIDPRDNYLHTGAHVLVGYALAADEQLPLAAATVLAGAGSDLDRLQFVDRAYGYELLAGAALHAQDLDAAQHWLLRAQSRPSDGMAAAAVARTEALLRTAVGELPESASAAARAMVSAASRGGSLDAARARVLHGSALSRIGSRRKALDELERVAASATELGALRIRSLAVREMRRLGRRVPPPGRESNALSPRELQVALLVADGLSNRQVARLLQMSERTVQTHVTTILRRLGLTSRAALPAALAPEAPPCTDGVLTARQQAVVELVARGLSNAEIAAELGVSPKTVEKHVGDAFVRCGVVSRTALAARWGGGAR
jgi:DNA-binding NarL/FixJ family response regulator